MKKLFCVVMVLLLAFAFVGCAANGNNAGKAAVGKEESDVFEIQTKYCVLKYPSKWQEKLEVTVADSRVSIQEKASKTPIFDLVFGEGDGDLLGVLTTKENTVEIRLITHSFSDNMGNIDELIAMQDDVNVIINYLYKDYDFKLNV